MFVTGPWLVSVCWPPCGWSLCLLLRRPVDYCSSPKRCQSTSNMGMWPYIIFIHWDTRQELMIAITSRLIFHLILNIRHFKYRLFVYVIDLTCDLYFERFKCHRCMLMIKLLAFICWYNPNWQYVDFLN